jgi:hypothetical protein
VENPAVDPLLRNANLASLQEARREENWVLFPQPLHIANVGSVLEGERKSMQLDGAVAGLTYGGFAPSRRASCFQLLGRADAQWHWQFLH